MLLQCHISMNAESHYQVQNHRYFRQRNNEYRINRILHRDNLLPRHAHHTCHKGILEYPQSQLMKYNQHNPCFEVLVLQRT